MPGLKVTATAILIALAAPAQAQQPVCPGGAKPMLRAEIYLGRNIGGRRGVSERAWRQFVARELSPRFPAGLTVIDGRGQWHGPSGSMVAEPSKIVILLVADAAPARKGIAQAAAYKKRFKQDSVAVVTRAVCVAF
jgi:Protein of unknown function (DUF3574)